MNRQHYQCDYELNMKKRKTNSSAYNFQDIEHSNKTDDIVVGTNLTVSDSDTQELPQTTLTYINKLTKASVLYIIVYFHSLKNIFDIIGKVLA